MGAQLAESAKVGNDPKLPAWQKVSGVEGLYLKTATGGYFSRYSLNGNRTFRTLETDVLTVAKLRHKQRQAHTEEDRQAGASLSDAFQRLGDLAAEVMARVNASERREGSKRAAEDQITRLRDNWQRGSFDSYRARDVTEDVLFELREYLRTKARVRTSRRWNTGKFRARPGYAGTVVNQTLWVLRQMLQIAAEKRVIPENPFVKLGALRKRLLLKAGGKTKVLPRRQDVESVFREMRIIRNPPALGGITGEDAWHKGHKFGNLAYRQTRANWTADHAEFLALTGMRSQEANAARIEDDKGEQLYVRGTKSGPSERFIPMHAQLRQLIDRLKTESQNGHLLKVRHSLAPLKRACARLNLPPLTHHALRHYYATICIESGVDIPTISRWLGHSDGGTLCMRTYGHLRDEHSRQMGQKIDFRPKV